MKQHEYHEKLVAMHQAKRFLRMMSADLKNHVLLTLADVLASASDEILKENTKDIQTYREQAYYQKAFEDRLLLTPQRLQQMTESLRFVASLPDPIGKTVSEKVLANGLKLRQVQGPLGLIFMIFESRPNVITEAFSLAFKAGNGLLLKGGKESSLSAKVIYRCINESLRSLQITETPFWGLEDPSRDTTDFLLKQNQFIDVLIPRGGDKLIEHVTNHSTIPIIKNDRGLCHLYVHEEADLAMAISILINAKTQRPSVCNSVETLLVDDSNADRFLALMFEKMAPLGVDFYACPKSFQILSALKNQAYSGSAESGVVWPVDSTSFDREYLDLKLNIKVVKNLKEAIEHIEIHGSRHSEAIITKNETVAKKFENEIDAAVVYWNASTRFTDGGQFGMGGEIGISTQKLHVRGPVGLDSLTTQRWIVEGTGQVRK